MRWPGRKAYLGTPCLLVTPLLRREWRRLAAKMSGWESASRPMADRTARREEASLRRLVF